MVPGQQPWVWSPLPPPFRNMTSLPTSRMSFRGLVRRILLRHGPGRYLILREQFPGEKPSYKPVVMFYVRQDGRYRLIKRYTQFKSHPEDPQGYWKEHRRRVLVVLDVAERMRQRRRQLLERIKHEVERPKPFKYKIVAKHWKMEY